MQTIKKAILKKSYWRGMSNSIFAAFYPAGTEVQVYKGKGRKSYTVILPDNQYDEVGGTWKGNTSDLKFIK
jgi:hypothetical protein